MPWVSPSTFTPHPRVEMESLPQPAHSKPCTVSRRLEDNPERTGMLRTLPSKSGPPEGAIQAHVARVLGPIQEVIRMDHDLQILVASDLRSGCLRLVTEGMSRQSLRTDSGQELYTELMLTLVPGTPTSWPIAVLSALAQYPFENDTFLYAGHTVENQGLPECPYPYFLLGPSVTAPEEFTLPTLGATPTLFLSIYPVYREEAQFRKQHGTTALQKRMERFHINDLVQEARLNSCDPEVERCERNLEVARVALRNRNPSLAEQNILESGHILEELSLSGHALAIYQLAGEPGAQAAERLKASGCRVDKAFLDGTQRRLMGLDFPPLTPKQLQFGLKIVQRIQQKSARLMQILLDTPSEQWSTKWASYSHEVMLEFMQEVNPQRERWLELACSASVWCFLDSTRDHHDLAEAAYRAVLSQGDDRSDFWMDLDALPTQLQGMEDVTLAVIAGQDPAHRRPVLAALGLWWRLDSAEKKTWQELAQRPAVAVTAGFVQIAARVVGPKILEKFTPRTR